MGYLSVIVAAVGCFAMGAVWYMSLGKVWAKAAGFEFDENGRPKGGGSMAPFAVGFLAALLLSGMLRHMFAMSGIDGLGKGLIAGLGVGLFVIAPWTWMNYAYAQRPRNLVLIDCGYAILGPAVAGAILGLF